MSLTFQQIMKLMLSGLLETLYMTIISTAAAYIIGLPVGVLLTVTDKDGIKPNKTLNTSIGFVVNVLRSVPFIILLVAVMPITRAIVGTTIGSSATVVPLVIAAAPYIARMVESSIKEVDRGVIEASHSMGATTLQIVLKVLIPEAKPSLLLGAAIRYGYNLGKTDVMLVMVVVLVAIVQLFQAFGGWFSRKNDRRIR